MAKCQYHQCTEEATEHAIGYDQYGDDHVYNVCRRHAEDMEPKYVPCRHPVGEQNG